MRKMQMLHVVRAAFVCVNSSAIPIIIIITNIIVLVICIITIVIAITTIGMFSFSGLYFLIVVTITSMIVIITGLITMITI